MSAVSNGSKVTMNRALWLPGSTPPAHLNGTMPGDYGASRLGSEIWYPSDIPGSEQVIACRLRSSGSGRQPPEPEVVQGGEQHIGQHVVFKIGCWVTASVPVFRECSPTLLQADN